MRIGVCLVSFSLLFWSAGAFGGIAGELEGYTLVSRSGNTVSSNTQIVYWEEITICTTGCSYRMYGVNDLRWSRNGNLLAGGGFSTTSYTYRVQLSGTGAPGECYAGTSSAKYDITAGTTAGLGIPIPFMPYTLDEGGPWGGSICIPSSAPAPQPPPVEVCDHCTGDSIVYEPLVLDFDGDGIPTTDQSVDPVLFDMNGDGVKDKTAWTVAGAEDAFLYVDWNNNRTIDGGQELFGDSTLLPNGEKATYGYEALGAYDNPSNGGNGDGMISHEDRIWPKLHLWFDRDHDGLATNDEDYTLPSRGVTALILTYTVMTPEQNYGIDASGNYHVAQGSFDQRLNGVQRGLPLHEIYFVAGRN